MYLYKIKVASNDRYYHDGSNDHWPLHVAKLIARNISLKHHVTTTLVRYEVQELVDFDTSYDDIVAYVDSLKGKAMTAELKAQHLPVGSDPVASKRIRLISHLVKTGNK